MSLFRPRSAYCAVALSLLLGCNSASPFKIFRGGGVDSVETLGENSINNQLPDSVDDKNVSEAQIAAAAQKSSNSQMPEIDLGQPASDDANSNGFNVDGMAHRLSDTSGGIANSTSADIQQSPTTEQANENPIQLASSSRSPFDAFRFALPGSARAREDALAREISSFDKFEFSFSLPTVAGEANDSRQFKGQLMVIDIWATWCAPCKRAIPDFIAIQEEFQAHGVQVVGITCDSADPADAPETARKAYAIGQQLGVNYPLLVDDGSTTKQVPGFRGYPTTLFMTPDGVVRYKVTGAQSKEKLASMINTILQR